MIYVMLLFFQLHFLRPACLPFSRMNTKKLVMM
jgi:hypothetical protein